jgi:dTDP-glucose 4,6-dehydratase
MSKVKSFVVTGGSGFIGLALCDYLTRKYPENTVLNVSKHTYAVSPKMAKFLEERKNYVFVPLDIFDSVQFLQLLRKHNVTRVYHLAAETHVDRSFEYPRDFLIANIEGTFSILEAIRALKQRERPKLYYMGTDEIFGVVKEGFKDENQMPHPENPYAATKVGCEALCQAWNLSFKIPVVIGRSMNVYGERQHPEKLIPKIITNILSGTKYQLYKGNSLRGWSYVNDTAEAIDVVMTRGKDGQIYHVPPAAMKGVYDINELILSLLPEGKTLFQGYVGKRLKDDDRYALSGTKMQHELGWTPKTTFEDGIRQTIDWYRTHKELWM